MLHTLYTNKILIKSQKDYKKLTNRPNIWDIVTFLGFLKYTWFRNSSPFIRDLFLLLLNNLEVFLIVTLAGKLFGMGGLFGYLFITLLYRVSQAIAFEARHEILENRLLVNKKNITTIITPYINITAVFSFLLLFSSLFLPINHNAKIVLFNKILSGVSSAIVMTIFTSVYSLTRIYIPLYSFIGLKLLSIFISFLGYKIFGIYGFIFGFYFYEITKSLYLMKKIKSLKYIKNISIKLKDYLDETLKLKHLYILYKITLNKKMFVTMLSFLLGGIQTLTVLIFVTFLYPEFVFSFYASYQVLRLLTMLAKRLSRSIFFDSTQLSVTGNYSLLNLYIHKTLILSMLLGAFVSLLFKYLLPLFVPEKYFTVLLDYILLDRWFWLYLLIFSSYITLILNRFLLITETYILYIFISIVEIIFIVYMLYNNKYLVETDDPLVFFPIKGMAFLFISIILLIIFYFRLWIYFSKIPKKRSINTINPLYTKINGGFIGIIILKKAYIGKISEIVEKEPFIKFSYNRVSPSTILVYNNFLKKEEAYIVSELFVPFSEFIYVVKKENLLATLKEKIDDIYSFSEEAEPERIGIYVKVNYVKNIPFVKVNKKDILVIKSILQILNYTQRFSYTIPDKLVSRLNLLPVIKKGKLKGLKKSSLNKRDVVSFLEDNICL